MLLKDRKFKIITGISISKYIDLARAKSEAPINSNLLFKSNNKLVFHNSVNFRTNSSD